MRGGVGFYLDGGGGGVGGGRGRCSLRRRVELCSQPFNLLEGSLMLCGGYEMLEHEPPPRRESLVESESLCTRPLCRIIGQAHVDQLLEILGDGPPRVVWEQLSRTEVVHLLHRMSLKGMEGVLSAAELEQDDTEGEDVSRNPDVWELADPCQQHLRGRILKGGCAALDVGGTIHPERIEAQRRPQIPDLHHRLMRAREDEEVGRLQVPVEDMPPMHPSQPPRRLESHPLNKLWGDVIEWVVVDILLESQAVGPLHVEAQNPLWIVDMCGEGPEAIGHPILPSPVEKMELEAHTA